MNPSVAFIIVYLYRAARGFFKDRGAYALTKPNMKDPIRP